VQANPTPDRGMSIDESQVAEHLKEKHLQMIMDAQQAGRQIKAVGVNPDIVGNDVARTSVEASQRTMRKAARKSFLIPALPWLKKGA
jgi:hypothetical protein